MESNELQPDLDTLRDAERARDDLAASVELPPEHDVVIGASVALSVFTFALGTTVDEAWARWALAGGVLVWWLVAALQVWRFSRLNGVRVRGYAPKVVLGNAPAAWLGYFVALAVAYAAASRDLWWLVGVAAVGGGFVYVLSGRRWLRAYRQEPARLGAPRDNLWVPVAVSLAGALAAFGLVFFAVAR